jgi:hypothetical protein
MPRVLRGSTRAACHCSAKSWRMRSMLSGILRACSGLMTSSIQEWPVIKPERLIACQCSASSWRMYSRLLGITHCRLYGLMKHCIAQ